MFATFKRAQFFEGQLLSADDLRLEQDYQREKRKLHNKYLFGAGVITGLAVSVKGRNILVEPGVALDCQGNEIVIPQCQVLEATDLVLSTRNIFLGLLYRENEIQEVPNTDSGRLQTVRIQESFEIVLAAENTNSGHRRSRGRLICCDQAHALTIARLNQRLGVWRIDRRYRAPIIR